MTMVWAREALARTKRLPKLDSWLNGTKPTAQDKRPVGTARDFMRLLSSSYKGGDIKKAAANG